MREKKSKKKFRKKRINTKKLTNLSSKLCVRCGYWRSSSDFVAVCIDDIDVIVFVVVILAARACVCVCVRVVVCSAKRQANQNVKVNRYK